MIVSRIKQDVVSTLDSVDIHNQLAQADHVVIEYHCGNVEECHTVSELASARDRIRIVESQNR